MKKKLYSFIALLAVVLGTTSCIKDKFDEPTLPGLPAGDTYTVAQIKAIVPDNNTSFSFEKDSYLYGTVVADESNGNLYKGVYIVNENSGIKLTFDNSTKGLLSVGDSIRVALKGLMAKNGQYGVEIATLKYEDNIFKQSVGNNVQPIEATLNDLRKPEFYGKVVKLSGVQFGETFVGQKFADKENGVSVSVTLVGCGQSGAVEIRTSGYSNFADKDVPAGSGSLVAVVGSYNQDPQLNITDFALVDMEGERCVSTVKTIAEIKALYTGSDKFQQITKEYSIEAVVTMNDQSGNYYKKLQLQDNSGAIAINIDKKNLWNTFAIGTKIKVNVNGLYLNEYGSIQLGSEETEGKLGRIPETQFDGIVDILDDGQLQPIQPLDIDLANLSLNNVDKLVKLSGVQFADSELSKNYAEPNTSSNRTLEDCNGNTIIVRTSGYSSFANDKVAQKNGSLIAILGHFGNDYQLTIRNIDEVDMTGQRCGEDGDDGDDNDSELDFTGLTKISVADLKAKATSDLVQITTDEYIEAEVTANDANSNIYKSIFLYDGTAGLEFGIYKDGLATDYPVGTMLKIKLKDLYVGKKNGYIILGGVFNGNIGKFSGNTDNHILKSGTASPLYTPAVKTITEAKNDAVCGQLIKLENVQFADAEEGKTYADNSSFDNKKKKIIRVLEDCDGNQINVKTSGFATFAGETLPAGKGTLVALLTKYNGEYELMIRNLNDVNLTGSRCGE
ncbi:MAG: DUF5689 domain-containing protein [Hyphomicrobiales bacterium]